MAKNGGRKRVKDADFAVLDEIRIGASLDDLLRPLDKTAFDGIVFWDDSVLDDLLPPRDDSVLDALLPPFDTSFSSTAYSRTMTCRPRTKCSHA